MAPLATEAVPITSKKEEKEYSSGAPDLAFPTDVPKGPPSFEDKYEERKYLKHRLALAFRVFAKFGFAEGVVGHITLRDPVAPDCFWVNPFGLHFSLVTADDLILVNHAGEVIDSGRNRMLNYAAFAIHSEIHSARPDVACAAHSHSVYGRAMCATGRELQMLTQDSCVFYKDHILYPTFAGVVLASDEGKHIAKALAHRKAVLLGNHGPLTAGKTIKEVVAYFVLLEKCCEVQLAADASAAGSGKHLVEIGEAEARNTWEALGHSASGYFMGLPLFRTV